MSSAGSELERGGTPASASSTPSSSPAPTPPSPRASKQERRLDALEGSLGIRFNDRSLLLRALTHRSWLNENDEAGATDNERLEFLGDALIDFVAGDHLFRNLPEAREGELTMLRAQLVQESALAVVAARLELGAHMRLGRGEIQNGGRERPAILCDVIEALVGALYIDSGYEVAEEAALRWLQPEIDRVLARDRRKDAKSAFQERVQATWQVTPHYHTVGESGPDHDKRFEVEVRVIEQTWATGIGRSKALAAHDAARRALEAWEERAREADETGGELAGDPAGDSALAVQEAPEAAAEPVAEDRGETHESHESQVAEEATEAR